MVGESRALDQGGENVHLLAQQRVRKEQSTPISKKAMSFDYARKERQRPRCQFHRADPSSSGAPIGCRRSALRGLTTCCEHSEDALCVFFPFGGKRCRKRRAASSEFCLRHGAPVKCAMTDADGGECEHLAFRFGKYGPLCRHHGGGPQCSFASEGTRCREVGYNGKKFCRWHCGVKGKTCTFYMKGEVPCTRKALRGARFCRKHGGAPCCPFVGSDGVRCTEFVRDRYNFCMRHLGRTCRFVDSSGSACSKAACCGRDRAFCIRHSGESCCMAVDDVGRSCPRRRMGGLFCTHHGGGWRCKFEQDDGTQCSGVCRGSGTFCINHRAPGKRLYRPWMSSKSVPCRFKMADGAVCGERARGKNLYCSSHAGICAFLDEEGTQCTERVLPRLKFCKGHSRCTFVGATGIPCSKPIQRALFCWVHSPRAKLKPKSCSYIDGEGRPCGSIAVRSKGCTRVCLRHRCHHVDAPGVRCTKVTIVGAALCAKHVDANHGAGESLLLCVSEPATTSDAPTTAQFWKRCTTEDSLPTEDAIYTNWFPKSDELLFMGVAANSSQPRGCDNMGVTIMDEPCVAQSMVTLGPFPLATSKQAALPDAGVPVVSASDGLSSLFVGRTTEVVGSISISEPIVSLPLEQKQADRDDVVALRPLVLEKPSESFVPYRRLVRLLRQPPQ